MILPSCARCLTNVSEPRERPRRPSWVLVLASVLALQTPPASAELYKCFDASGKVTYSSAPCSAQDPDGPPNKVLQSHGREAASGGRITQEQALATLQAVDKAAARMDLDAVLGHFADSAVVDVSMHTSRGVRRGTMGKAQYRRLWRESKNKVRGYRFRRDNTRVSIDPDGAGAEVNSTLTEYWNDPGGPMMLVSEETYVVELRGGRPKVSSLSIVSGAPKPPR